jgi:hypothetical protein
VAAVHGKFEELNFPYDVLWLDIEHTDGKRYLTLPVMSLIVGSANMSGLPPLKNVFMDAS